MYQPETTARNLTRAAALFGISALFAGSASAQKSDAEARSEIEFARGLAADWGFVSLSEDVIRDLEKEGVSTKLGEELGLLKCDIYFEAAKSDKLRRDELLQQALQSYEDFIARNAFSEFLQDAEANLIDVSSYYGRSLSMQLETAAGDEADAIKGELQTVLEGAIDKTGDLIDGLKSIPHDDRTEADKKKLFELIFNRGDMLLELAKTQEDGTFSFEQSNSSFESLVDEAGEASPWGLKAFIGIGDNLQAQGEWDEASGFYEFVVEMAISRDKAAWEESAKEMTLDEKQKRFLFVQMGTSGLVDSLAKAGRPDEAAAWGLHFYNIWKREGLDLVTPVGPLSLLGVSRTLVDAGGTIGGNLGAGEAQWFATVEDAQEAGFTNPRDRRGALDLALSMAQSVNSENKGTNLQLRAQKVISEIISRPGVRVDPEILFEAAQGEYFDKNYHAALDGFKRVLSSLEGQDAAKRIEIGSKTLWHVGRSYRFLDRYLEAAVTFQEAVLPTSRWRGDPQYDEENAKGYYETMQALRRTARNDPIIEGMWRESEQIAKELTETMGAEVAFREAVRLYDAGKYAEARKAYGEVTPNAESYEKALVFIGVCDYKVNDFDGAAAVFNDYVNGYLENPINTTTDPRRIAKRKEATATAWFYWGLGAYKQADAGAGKWEEVIAKLANFHTRFPDQTSFAPAALYRVMIAHTKLDDNLSARKVYEDMLKGFPDAQWTGRAATDFYKILKGQYEAQEAGERKTALLREMAEALQVLNLTSPSPSFNNMRAESRHWMELEEWGTAEELLSRISTKFGEDEDEGEEVVKYVVPDLGEALLRQYKVQEAAARLKPLIDENQANRKTARIWSLALAGWLEHEEADGQIVIKQAAGVGGEEGFSQASAKLNQLTEASEKWEEEWYGYKLDLIYAYHQWGQVDGKKLETAKSQIGFLVSNLGPQFQHEKIDEPTRMKFLWLADQLK